MGKQVTASRTALFLNCQWAFGPDVELPHEETVDEAPRYGSAFHKLFEWAPLKVGEKFDNTFAAKVDNVGVTWNLTPSVREELAGHVKGSLPVLQKWLGGKNPFDLKFDVELLQREKSYAILPSRRAETRIREIAGPTAVGHVYEELKDSEVAGTGDLISVSEVSGFVMDYKTGSQSHDFATPSKNDQLKTLALATGGALPIAAIFHADRRGLPVIYAEEIEEPDLHRHSRKLALAMKRRTSGYMRPGEWCRYCPARTICPTQTADLLTGAASLVVGGSEALARTSKADALATPDAVGAMHQFFAEFDRLKERARPLMKARVKAFLEDKKFSQRPDGKVLVIRTRAEERLSKKAITDALGAKEAERLFERLRKAGALLTTESEGLYAEFPD
jgi:hypothetical protein